MVTKADFQLVRSLADKHSRTQHGLFVAEGDKLVGEIIANPEWHIERLFVAEGSKVISELNSSFAPNATERAHIAEQMQGLRSARNRSLLGANEDFEHERNTAVACEICSPKEMERLSALKSAPRSLALVRLPKRKPFVPSAEELIIALDEVQDPGNLGTIIRTADWYGIRRIVCSPTTADCFAPKVVQATMGALLRVEVHYCDLHEWLGIVRTKGIPTYATTLDGKDIHTAPLSRGGVIIMGNEGKGVSPAVQTMVEHKLFIPPYPADRHGSESLNVAIATAITCENFRNKKG